MTVEADPAPEIDFTRVDGVGPKSAEALRKAGITSMRELASMTVEEVVVALRDNGVEWPAGRIVSQAWLQQAWRLSRVGLDLHGRYPEEGETPGAQGSAPSINGWEEHTGFFVYFDRSAVDPDRWRTRVWDTTAMVEHHLPGVVPETWMAFILARAGLPSPGPTNPSRFHVDRAELDHVTTELGVETWLQTDVRIKIGNDSSLAAGLGSALLDAALDRGPG